jgi:ADP-heptose:LPS heptosyltransferase
MNSHGEMRYYPIDHWVKLAEICRDKTFVWFADRPEFAQVTNIPENVINTGGKLNFSEFITMWMNCEICIGPDSGGMNISGTNNQDYIALIGSTKAKDHIINYKSISTITAKPNLDCSPCYDWQIRNDCAGKGVPWCMDRITPYQISREIYRLTS